MVWRTIRGMLPHKTARGAAALSRLSTFEGTPHPYDKMKRQVIPAALRILRLKPGRNYCIIGDLAHSVGWRHKELLEKLEDKRKLRSQAFYEKTKAKAKVKQEALKQATADGSLTKVQAVLSASGY